MCVGGIATQGGQLWILTGRYVTTRTTAGELLTIMHARRAVHPTYRSFQRGPSLILVSKSNYQVRAYQW